MANDIPPMQEGLYGEKDVEIGRIWNLQERAYYSRLAARVLGAEREIGGNDVALDKLVGKTVDELLLIMNRYDMKDQFIEMFGSGNIMIDEFGKVTDISEELKTALYRTNIKPVAGIV